MSAGIVVAVEESRNRVQLQSQADETFALAILAGIVAAIPVMILIMCFIVQALEK